MPSNLPGSPGTFPPHEQARMSDDSQRLTDAVTMMERAYSLLDEHEVQEAREIGEELKKVRFSGGFEILAACCLQDDDQEGAIKILEEGTSVVPQAWPLWRQLGILYSDQKRHDLARSCYEEALACPGVEEPLLRFDQALVHYREWRHDEALRLLDALPEKWKVPSAALKASVLNRLERYEEAIDHCRFFLENNAENFSAREQRTLMVELAVALWEKDKSPEALPLLRRAVVMESDLYALQKLRELNDRRSAQASHFCLIVKGKWHEPFDGESHVLQFLRALEVVADSPEEALGFARELEPEPVAASLVIDEYEEMEAQPGLLKGVYEATGHIFFEKE